jgi:hypothetical protein
MIAVISTIEVERFRLISSRSFDEVLAATNNVYRHAHMADWPQIAVFDDFQDVALELADCGSKE